MARRAPREARQRKTAAPAPAAPGGVDAPPGSAPVGAEGVAGGEPRPTAGQRTAAAAGTAVTATRAASGDVTAQVKLGSQAVRGLARSKLLRILIVGGLLLMLATLGVMCGIAGSAGNAAGAAGTPPVTVRDGPMWAAYRHAAGMTCTGDGHVVIDPDGDDLGFRPDMTVVASVGRIESAHGRAVRSNPQFDWVTPGIDAFGRFVVPVLSVPLYDPADFHPHLEDNPKVSTVADHDGGRWDLNPFVDHAVGPTQTLPTFVAAFGFDASGDGIVDPHNVLDAVGTTAAFFCRQAAAGRTLDEAVMAYSNDEEYLEVVARDYMTVRARFENAAPWSLPAGAPLGFDPTAAARWEPHLADAARVDPLLVALADAVGDPSLDGGGISLRPDDIDCGAGGICVWNLPWVARSTATEWQAVGEVGLAAPTMLWDRRVLVVSGALPASGFTIAWPVPSMAGNPDTPLEAPVFPPPADRVALPMSVTPWPPTPLAPPTWLDWHIAAGDPAWSQLSGDGALHLPAVAAAEVFSPVAGTRTVVGDGCAAVSDSRGWLWQLCGVHLDVAARSAGPTWTGQRLGHTSGTELTVTLVEPAGLPACPQSLIGRWSQDATGPNGAFRFRSGGDITDEIFALWAAADAQWAQAVTHSSQIGTDPDAEDIVAALIASALALEAEAEVWIVDLFESCQHSGYLSPFRSRRPARPAGAEALIGGG